MWAIKKCDWSKEITMAWDKSPCLSTVMSKLIKSLDPPMIFAALVFRITNKKHELGTIHW